MVDSSFVAQRHEHNPISDSALDKENVLLPMSDLPPQDLDDDSLIKALLDHVERTDLEDQPTEPVKPVKTMPLQRTFEEVSIAGKCPWFRHFL